MPFETLSTAPKRIAVIGGGISGLGAAHLLSKSHRVTLFEADRRLGGHARTVLAGKNGDQPVDTGFIVYNETNYPHLTRLFEDLDVPIIESNMSFGASLNGGALEYALHGVDAVFAQRKNLLSPKYLKMIRDIQKFNAQAYQAADDPDISIGEFVNKLGLGDWFRDYYLLPFTGAIWSTPKSKMMEFPAQAMIQFMQNHALLDFAGQHQWYTVKGGSIQYVDRLAAKIAQQGADVRLGASVKSVTRTGAFVEVAVFGGLAETFDEVVFACHSDQALAMLTDPSEYETSQLGAICYQLNDAVLHADTRMMPKRKKCWASWVYCEEANKTSEKIDLTYWMNSLQAIPQDDPLFVTLNSTREIRDELIYDTTTFHHPVFDVPAIKAQTSLRETNGSNQTWFCGAWMKNGFHEDGLSSAHDVALSLQTASLAVAAE